MWRVPPMTNQYREQTTATDQNILAQITKQELANYYYAALFILTKTILLKAVKQGFINTWQGLTEVLIKKHLERCINTTMTQLHMKHQWTQ